MGPLIQLPTTVSISVILFATQGLKANDAEQQPHRTPTMTRSDAGDGVGNLPYSRGKRFGTLDAYLAHLEQQGAIDLPWWREVRPGVYEYMVRMPGAQREIATRAELMRRFGFQR